MINLLRVLNRLLKETIGICFILQLGSLRILIKILEALMTTMQRLGLKEKGYCTSSSERLQCPFTKIYFCQYWLWKILFEMKESALRRNADLKMDLMVSSIIKTALISSLQLWSKDYLSMQRSLTLSLTNFQCLLNARKKNWMKQKL